MTPLPFAGSTLRGHRHVCALFRTPEEEYRIVFPFVLAGIESGDRVVCIIPDDRRDYLDRLRGAGVDVDEAQRRYQLEVFGTAEMYNPDGHVDTERSLSRLVDTLMEGRSLGFPVTRLIGHPESALQSWQDTDRFLEYEARLNYALPGYDDPVICTYDLDRITAGVAFNVLRTHPTAVIGGLLQENPFFVPPDVFLEELRARDEGAARRSGDAATPSSQAPRRAAAARRPDRVSPPAPPAPDPYRAAPFVPRHS